MSRTVYQGGKHVYKILWRGLVPPNLVQVISGNHYFCKNLNTRSWWMEAHAIYTDGIYISDGSVSCSEHHERQRLDDTHDIDYATSQKRHRKEAPMGFHHFTLPELEQVVSDVLKEQGKYFRYLHSRYHH